MARKEIRQRQLVTIILEEGNVPRTSELAKRLGVTERTIRRDLEDLARLIPAEAVKDIERGLLLRLRDRVPDMSDSDLIKLAEFFLAKRSRVDTQFEGSVEVHRKPVDLREALEEYGPVIAKLLSEENRRPSENGEVVNPSRVEGRDESGEDEESSEPSVSPSREVEPSAEDEESEDAGASPLPEYATSPCPRCGGPPVFDSELAEWLCLSCQSPLRLLWRRMKPR